ncbi:OTUB1 [Cordylochernes scorpioides]|uniref:ubiquitinyl hydrolase 1 n=1 Tax=Cordylochernes scorpioides TaxID=51811 RepID=A0ABY6L591_9ARAC|nr:OTUB1 [Cordylochernes scorpioides]
MIIMVELEMNQDEAIMAQEREIEREIAENIPLVGPLVPITNLYQEYASDDLVYRAKIKDLLTKFKFIRKTRPDGNCFFRAFCFAYLESLLDDNQEFSRFKKIALVSKDDLISLGFPQFTIEDFYDTFMEVLEKMEKGISLEELLEVFNDQSYSDYLVVYMRLITSGYLQRQESFFSNFIEGPRSVKEFCQQEVEPMFKESDHIHIIAITLALNIGARVQYMDRGTAQEVNSHDFPDSNKQPRVHLLYRPGHYDILYP